jgi:cell division protein FtsI/penicillin-binding protein 2
LFCRKTAYRKIKRVIFLFSGKIKLEMMNLKGDFVFEKRLAHLKIIFIFLICVLCLRLGEIAIINGRSLEAMAQLQQVRTVEIENIRGAITDRHGESLTGNQKETLYLASDGSVAREKNENKFCQFEKIKRTPHLAKHLIGYTSPDGEGKSGLEKLFNNELKEDKKIMLSYVADATGSVAGNIETTTPKSEKSLKLTIDKQLQTIAERVMDKHIKKGALVLLDAQSFDVLAMVSAPSFNEDAVSGYNSSSEGELLNRALMGYNAGSVFKIVTSAAILEKDENYIQRYFDCRGSFTLPDGHSFACNKKEGHGILYFPDSFADSCNCSFYVTGLEAGGEAIVAMAKKFGIGRELLNTELQEEAKGNLPQRSIYSQAEILNLSIGQGEILITPLQCAALAATVANGGIRKEINIVSSSDDGKKNKNLRKTGEERVISEKTAEIIADMMRRCVTSGTASSASQSFASISGKTGSAESGWIDDGKPMVHGWFCGFFPSDKPKYAMAILSEGGESGSRSCVAPFVEIAEKIIENSPLKE